MTAMTKERPILFSAPMVRVLLDGSKTQTRRVCKPAEAAGLSFVVEVPDPQERGQVYNGSHFGNEEGGVQFACPYGGVGDRLWVRETHRKIIGQSGGWIETDFRASYTHCDRLGDHIGKPAKWTPSIHMPRDASRIDLEVTDVRVERLQAISEPDAAAEGVFGWAGEQDTPVRDLPEARLVYRQLWEQINGAGSWDLNPWVWVVEFKRVHP